MSSPTGLRGRGRRPFTVVGAAPAPPPVPGPEQRAGRHGTAGPLELTGATPAALPWAGSGAGSAGGGQTAPPRDAPGPAGQAGPDGPDGPRCAPPPGAPRTEAVLAERTADLQRVKAEYDNYRKRVRRDRRAVREIAAANVLGRLLPVLDAVDRAGEHHELTGGFQQVAEVLRTETAALGLQPFGDPGDPFDPACHEALDHRRSAEVDRAVCSEVLRPGYRVGRHLLRPAEVIVSEPLPRAGTV